jgi:hypothetical protein
MSDRRIETLEDALREFTSVSGLDFDETFEGIMRNEFNLMRVNLEKQISSLKEAVNIEKRNTLIEKA